MYSVGFAWLLAIGDRKSYALNQLLMLSPEGRGCAIVVIVFIVALAVLVVLGGSQGSQ